MPDANVPYVMSYGNITKVLERIRTAQVPPRFSQDFLETTLNLSGGSARPLIPFLKRTGFLGSDGTPTDLYKRFRDDTQRGGAAAEALKIGYADLYRVNEYIHDATDAALKGVVLQVTNFEPGSSTVKAIIGSFKAIKADADFTVGVENSAPSTDAGRDGRSVAGDGDAPLSLGSELRIGYTINLNLPATSDIAVFDAIFKSLKDHLL